MKEEIIGRVRRLSPKIKIVWLGKYLLFVAVILIVGWLINSTVENTFRIKPNQLYIGILAIATFFFIFYLVFIEIKYRHFKYYFTQRGIVIEKGILHKEKYVVPYEKIQNINIEYTIPLRILGIGKIIIETAGTNLKESETTLDGIDDPEGFVREAIREVEAHSTDQKVVEPVEFEESKEEIEELAERMAELLKKVYVLEERVKEFEEKLKLLDNIILKEKASHSLSTVKQKKPKKKEKVKKKTTKPKKKKSRKR